MANQVTDLINALREGTMSIEEVAAKFRQRRWPRREGTGTTSASGPRIQNDDPEPYIPGSFDDVTIAYNKGFISDNDYDVLARAMTESKLEEDIANGKRK